MARCTSLGGLKLRDALRNTVRSEQMSALMERFHGSLAAMEMGLVLQDSRVCFTPKKNGETELSEDLILDHLLRRLKFESAFDPKTMGQAMRLAQELDSLKRDLLTSGAFLSSFLEMLGDSKNSDDLRGLAALCLDVFSAHGANLGLSGDSEIEHPSLVIEMTKAHISLLMSLKGVPAAAPAVGFPSEAKEADPAKKQESPKPDGADAANAPATDGDAAPSAKCDENAHVAALDEPPLSLKERLDGIGLWAPHVEDILNVVEDAEKAKAVFDNLKEEFGAGLLAMALCKNKFLLNNAFQGDKITAVFFRAASKMEQDAEALESYRPLCKALLERLGFSISQVHAAIEPLAYRKIAAEEAIATLDFLLQSAPQDAARSLILGKPELLGRRKELENLLSQMEKNGLIAKPEAAESTPAIRLRKRLEALGVGSRLIDLLEESPRYGPEAEKCLENLDEFIKTHGEHMALLALYKNREMLLGKDGTVLDSLMEDVSAVRADSELRAKYQNVTKLITSELGLPEECIYPFLRMIKITEGMLLENLGVLLSRVPREEMRGIVLCSPYKLSSDAGLKSILDEHPVDVVADGEKLVEELVAAMQDRVSEAFIRAYVNENLGCLGSRSVGNVKTKVDYWARTLVKLSTQKGIPQEFSKSCISEGIIDIARIEDAYARQIQIAGLSTQQAFNRLRDGLEALGMDSESVIDLLTNYSCAGRPHGCIENLEALLRMHGPGGTLVVLSKKPNAIANIECALPVARDLARVRNDAALLEKYARLRSMLVSDVGLPDEGALMVLSRIRTGTEERFLDDLNMMIARVPKERLRIELLRLPHALTARATMDAILESAQAVHPVDARELIENVIRLSEGRRPPAFVKSVIISNAASFVLQSPERVWTHVEYKARILQGLATARGILPTFTQGCIEKGIISIEGVMEEAARAQAAPKKPERAEHEPESGASGQRFDEPQAEGPMMGAPEDGADMAEAEAPAHMGEPAAMPEPEQEQAPELNLEHGLSELFLSVRMDSGKSALALKTAIDRGNLETVFARMDVALDFVKSSMRPDMDLGTCIRSFLDGSGCMEALLDTTHTRFDDMLVEYADSLAELSRTRAPAAPDKRANDSIRHIRVSATDIALFERIRAVEPSEEVRAFLETRSLDPHEFAYVVLKIFHWAHNGPNRLPEKIKKDDYDTNLARCSNGASKPIATVLKRLLCNPRPSNVTLKSENDLNGIARELRLFLKDVKTGLSQ